MDQHVKILGWLWVVVGALSLIGAICAVVTIAGGGLISQEQEAIIATSIVAGVSGFMLVLSGVIDLAVGIGLLKLKSWSRILAIIKGILDLWAFPIGTALGIYTLVIMFNKETPPLFESGA